MSDELGEAFANRAAIESERIQSRKPTPAATNNSPQKTTPVVKAEKAEKLTPKTIVKMSRQRLRDVTREIKTHRRELKKLEVEETQLAPLLDAADGKPEKPNNLRSIARETGS